MIWYSAVSILVCWATVDGKLFRFDYDYYGDAQGWLKLHRVPATWRDARLRCFREGAVLASPENENIRNALQNILKNSQETTCGIFTGIHATYSKGDYFSIEGTPLNRIPINWAPNEPDNADNSEDCLLMLVNGTMADVNCSDVFPYVCYKKKIPNLAVNNCGTVDNSYALDARTGSCYKFHTEPQTWPRAFSACSGEGGHLAIINSETEAQVLREIYAKHPPASLPGNFIKHVVHIGHTDWEEHGMWMTIHGQTLQEAGYAKWAGGQPDNATSQFCGAMFNNGQLDDVWCDRPCPFICEKKPDSLLSDNDICRPICKGRRREWKGQIQLNSEELLLERKPIPECFRRRPKEVYPNGPCPLHGKTKNIKITEKYAERKPKVIRICQAPLDVTVETPYLDFVKQAFQIGALPLSGRKRCPFCNCADCCDCSGSTYVPQDAEQIARRRAHMHEFDRRVRGAQGMRIMYDKD